MQVPRAQTGQRIVQQQYFWFENQSPRQRRALAPVVADIGRA